MPSNPTNEPAIDSPDRPCPSLDQLRALLEDALSPAARTALEAHTEGCPVCLKRLSALVAQSEDTLLNARLRAAGMPAEDPELTPLLDRVRQAAGARQLVGGKYKLLEEIGTGGMGTVWMAQQIEPVKRNVAVKLIKVGMDSRAVLARFDAERQALAIMDHPNIARVLDAGSTPDGRPYFVMELVKGVPITQFCDDRKLTPRERLELFVPVCQAIQHAHQKGVIHRDIKPNNVLVALYDDRPVPKVIDFGVAKATGSALTDLTLTTGFGAVVGTPEYMSPEQASLNNLDIDTRSDVYALGVLLYELLTGTTPVDRQSLGRMAILEILRIVREVEAPRPSSKLSSMATLPSVAANRHTEPKRLSKMLKGELDWVVLKALEKDRTRRYESANGLARDIQRYLADEMVEARPPSTGYRLKKLVKRNGVELVAAVTLFLALVAGVIGTTLGLFEARRQAGIAFEEGELKEDARIKAVAAADKEKGARLAEERQRKFAEAIAAFVKHDFLALTSVEGQDRFDGEGLGRNATLLDILNRAAGKLKERKDLDPLIEAELCWIVGVNYRGAGDAAIGVPFLERAVELRRSVLGSDHADTLDAQNSLGLAYIEAGKLDEALQLLDQTLNRSKNKLGLDHLYTLASMNNLAICYREAGKLNEAISLHERTLKLREGSLDPEHNDSIKDMGNLALCYQAIGKLEKALPLLEETLRRCKAKLGPDHRDTLTTSNNWRGATGKQVISSELYCSTRTPSRSGGPSLASIIRTPSQALTTWHRVIGV